MTKKTVVLFLAILAVLFVGAVTVKYRKGKMSELSCKVNDECIILSKYENNSCCPTCDVEVFNKTTAETQEKWRSQNCQFEQCLIHDCYTEKIPQAICVNGICKIDWLSRK